MNSNGSTPAETPRAKYLDDLAQLYEIPFDATADEAVRICAASMRATHGRLAVIEGHMIEFATKLGELRRKHKTHWIWPLATGFAVAVALAEVLTR